MLLGQDAYTKRMWKRRLGIGFAILFSAGVLVYLIILGYSVDWTGFAGYKSEDGQVRPKTLWDWMDLLIIPVTIAVVAAVLRRLNNAAKQRIESDRQRHSLLNSFVDNITELLLEENLRSTAGDNEAREIARTRTLVAFRELDGDRKAHALQFLKESGLIASDPIVELQGANLDEADLSTANLSYIEIRGAYFRSADLSGATIRSSDLRGCDFTGADLSQSDLSDSDFGMATLSEVDLRGADLSGTRLYGAELNGADLSESNVTEEQLNCCSSYEDAKLPTSITKPSK